MYIDWEDVGSFLLVALMVIVGLTVFFGSIGLTVNVIQKNYCENIERLHAGLEVDYSLWSNCRIKTPEGKWILSEEYLQYYGDMHTLQIGEVGE